MYPSLSLHTQMETLVQVGQTLGKSTGIDPPLNNSNYDQVLQEWEDENADSTGDSEDEEGLVEGHGHVGEIGSDGVASEQRALLDHVEEELAE